MEQLIAQEKHKRRYIPYEIVCEALQQCNYDVDSAVKALGRTRLTFLNMVWMLKCFLNEILRHQCWTQSHYCVQSIFAVPVRPWVFPLYQRSLPTFSPTLYTFLKDCVRARQCKSMGYFQLQIVLSMIYTLTYPAHIAEEEKEWLQAGLNVELRRQLCMAVLERNAAPATVKTPIGFSSRYSLFVPPTATTTVFTSVH